MCLHTRVCTHTIRDRKRWEDMARFSLEETHCQTGASGSSLTDNEKSWEVFEQENNMVGGERVHVDVVHTGEYAPPGESCTGSLFSRDWHYLLSLPTASCLLEAFPRSFGPWCDCSNPPYPRALKTRISAPPVSSQQELVMIMRAMKYLPQRQR